MRRARRAITAVATPRGFTTGELMVAIAVFSVVGAAIGSVTIGTLNSFGYQARMVDAQTELANAMVLLQDDLRLAGYVTDNMNQSIFQQLLTGTGADSIQFVGDVNSDNVSDRVTWALTNGTLMRTQDTWDGTTWVAGAAQPVAVNVTAFGLKFRSIDPCTGLITQQTASDVLTSGTTSYVTLTLTGTGSYKGTTVVKTLTTDVAGRQENVRPVCS